jgi:hypothetical protein
MESLIRQGRLSRHSLLVHLRTFIGSEIFYSSCDEEDAILKDIVAAQIAIISASLYPGMPYSATHTATTVPQLPRECHPRPHCALLNSHVQCAEGGSSVACAGSDPDLSGEDDTA